MSSPRLFVPPERILGDRARLTPEDERYLGRVLRLAAGDGLEVFDGKGGRWPARFLGTAELELAGPRALDEAGARRLALWQGLGKGDKMDFVVQKAAELGAARVVPLVCRRSVVRLEGERAVARVTRWRKVGAEAARQCGRADVPEIAAPAALDALCERAEQGAVALLDPAARGAPGLAAVLAEPAFASAPEIAIAVGPEGGFDPDEIESVMRAGGRLATLGRRTLRTETAAVVACALWAQAGGELG